MNLRKFFRRILLADEVRRSALVVGRDRSLQTERG
jgi:hypothetical protein